LVAEPNATSIAEKILLFFQKDPSAFLENIKEEKKKYNWKKLVDAITN